MLELLKILAEAVLKLLDPAAIEKFRREGKQRQLGICLFRLYIELMDLIIRGERLLELLGDVVEHKGLIRFSENHRERYSERLRIAVERQAAIVENFSRAFAGLLDPLLAIDAEAIEIIGCVIGIKGSYMDAALRDVLWRGHLPLEQITNDEPASTKLEHFQNLQHKIFTDFLPALAEWTDDDYEKAKGYLSAAKEHLTQLRASTSKLKTSLEAHFSLKDVLPELSNPK